MITAERYHDFSYGHRVCGHESKCAHLHGHNGRVTFVCEPEQELDKVGRVLDFSAMKASLCMWLERNWDHKFLAWKHDDVMRAIYRSVGNNISGVGMVEVLSEVDSSIVWVDFNPTAENMAHYLLHRIGPKQLHGTGVRLVKVVVEETRKCSATAALPSNWRTADDGK